MDELRTLIDQDDPAGHAIRALKWLGVHRTADCPLEAGREQEECPASFVSHEAAEDVCANQGEGTCWARVALKETAGNGEQRTGRDARATDGGGGGEGDPDRPCGTCGNWRRTGREPEGHHTAWEGFCDVLGVATCEDYYCDQWREGGELWRRAMGAGLTPAAGLHAGRAAGE